MSSTTTKKTWIQLQMSDPTLAGVTVQPENGDLFSLATPVLGRLGKIAAQFEQFSQQLADLGKELSDWSSQRSNIVSKAYLVSRGDHFLFLAVLKGTSYDGDFEDALTDLDMKVAQDPSYELINLSVLALPSCAEAVIRSFLPHRTDSEDVSQHAE